MLVPRNRIFNLTKPCYKPAMVTIERNEGIATLWLERAEKRNALNSEMMQALAAALDEVRDDASVRVVVLRGRGAVFSSGIDHTLLLELFQKAQSVPFAHLHHDLQDVFNRLERMQKPIVAAIHTVCVGMALELALACDLRLATSDTVFGLPEVAFGLVPDVGGTTRLTREIGTARARELVLTGKLINAETAERYGVIHEVATDLEDLERRLNATCALLAAHSPKAVGTAKDLVRASADVPNAVSLRLEGLAQLSLLADPELATRFPTALAFIKTQVAQHR